MVCFPRGMGRLRNLRRFGIYQSLGFIPRVLMAEYILRKMVGSVCHKMAPGGLKVKAVRIGAFRLVESTRWMLRFLGLGDGVRRNDKGNTG